jgi:hypothetical protein
MYPDETKAKNNSEMKDSFNDHSSYISTDSSSDVNLELKK